ncbi:flagellar basal-body rod protein FlgF [Geobacter argillaceus]|uniref:Flagellar basal-body rod protein FlgG n=1 Tax=Geobacter argillaceus TaxID=345631 RepID=A0A562VJR3_9BACT|nr:flagellar basal-body rod protein FlgF [Geobacter argillaceus]TWJ18052.1 flagellar basal-body rod protein FlgG [Geobacter argillaceus]
MNSGLYTALSGNLAAMRRLDVISNNLANANTAGFKKDRVAFESLLALRAGEAPEKAGLVQADNIYFTDYSAGPVKQTGNTLDLAIDGDGFFAVNTPQGRAYTRQGNFQRNAAGRLVTNDGYEVVGSGGPVTINGSRVEVSARGEVMVDGEQVATLEVVDFPKPYALQKAGSALFVPADPQAAPQPVRTASVRQGHLEDSNVSVVQEMVQMIEANRYFEACQRVVKSYDDAAGKAANDIGRV